MSRPDIQDYDYPPGLPMARQRVDHDSHHHYHSASLSGYTNLPERSGSNYATLVSTNNTTSMQSSMPRSLAMHERDFPGQPDTWPSASNANRRTPSMNVPQVQPANHLSSTHISSSPKPSHSNGSAGGLNLDSGGTTTPSARHSSFQPSSHKDRDSFLPRVSQPPPTPAAYSYPIPSPAAASSSRSTLWWGELEPWMDEEYAKQVCGLMGWDPVTVKVPHPAPDPTTGQQANNPGYCFLTFPSPSHAASVLSQINNQSSGTPITMPNSTKPFLLNWASSTPITPSLSPPGAAPQQAQYPKEYSIFVGDLAPEASNSDLVAVFRNPVLGLRNDREPKFIRPFLSCKSAKIMLDPVTGVSRGYGFVRFTDEADQQRALIEMHGLYCLSRPMRISPATAKYKPPPSVDLPQVQTPGQNPMNNEVEDSYQSLALAMGAGPKRKSVTSPVAGGQLPNGSTASSGASGVSSSASGSTFSAPSLSSGPSTSTSGSSLATANSEDFSSIPQNVLSQIAQFASGNAKPAATAQSSITAPFAGNPQDQVNAARYGISEESWKHQAQARAILSNLIGPNGEQLTSTDPYNTTVFVGGLSPLISEDTLRTFFAPFGDIHYVKVPVGKHCGFVQFVRKADAERAIEKMQGFPIGGSRIRLSWGRSQYKAAQAAAQAAQAAALQSQLQAPPPSSQPPLTAEQAIQLLQKFGLANFLNPATDHASNTDSQLNEESLSNLLLNREEGGSFDIYSTNNAFSNGGGGMGNAQSRSQISSSFSPFSPDPNMFFEQGRRDSMATKTDMLPHQIKTYGPSFGAGALHPHEISPGPTSPTGTGQGRPPSVSQRFGPYMEQSIPGQRSANPTAISRPPSSKRVSPPTRERHEYFDFHEQEQIQDLNGTLASLDLDHGHVPSWRAQDCDGGPA